MKTTNHKTGTFTTTATVSLGDKTVDFSLVPIMLDLFSSSFVCYVRFFLFLFFSIEKKKKKKNEKKKKEKRRYQNIVELPHKSAESDLILFVSSRATDPCRQALYTSHSFPKPQN